LIGIQKSACAASSWFEWGCALSIGVNSFSADELSETLWVDLLPWLDDYVSDRAVLLEPLAPSPDWWFSESPSFTALEVDLEKVLEELAEVYVAHHGPAVLAESFPALDADLPVAALALDTRATTALRRLTSESTLACVLPHTVTDLFGVRGTSAQTVQDIVYGLLVCTVMRDPRAGIEDDATPDAPPVITALVDDLRQLAVWRRARGQGDRPLVTVEIDDESPEPIQELAARVSALTPADLPDNDRNDAVDEIENLVAQLDERESLVLRERLVAVDRMRLGAVGAKLAVSAGRAGQIEADVKAKLNAACGFGTGVGNLLASLRVEIQPVASLDRLLSAHPVLAAEVPSLHVPLWLVLDRLDDYFEVTDSWAAAPSVSAAVKRTQTLLEDYESPNGVVALDDVAAAVSMPRAELEVWLTRCGFTVVADSALTHSKRIADLAVGALEAIGAPRSAEQLVGALASDRPARSVDTALKNDERVILEDGVWRLADWETAKPAAAEAEEAPNFSEFGVHDDGSLRRTRASKGKTPEQTRQLYRSGVTWYFRIRVTADQLRGSGFAVPAGVAAVAGCRRGEVAELSSDLGAQMIRWTGAQPTFGTIRRFLRALSADVGDVVLLEFGPERSFGVRRPPTVPEDAEPLRRALAEMGHPEPLEVRGRDLPRVVADAIGLSGETRPRRILSAYRDRGEDTITELLEQAWVHGTDTTDD
jgi:hypothetical protein